MSSRRLFDFDPITGIVEWFEYDPDTDTVTLTREQDVEPFLEASKTLARDPEYTRIGIKRDWWHYAHIPAIVIEKWMREKGVNVLNQEHTKEVFKLVNDPEWRYLKTTTKFHKPRD